MVDNLFPNGYTYGSSIYLGKGANRMLKDEVLYLLDKNRGRMVTGGELARELNVSRTAIWKAIGALRDEGNGIESIQGAGYRLNADSDGLSRGRIADLLATRDFGRSLEVLASVDSTNSYLKGQNTAALPHGHTVIADGQSGGRGRMGRGFSSPAGEGLYMSVLLKPDIPPAETRFLTICAAVAVCGALEEVFGITPEIKWVNDIFCGGRKLCGILTEAFVSAEMQAVDYAVVGLGINTGRVADEIAAIATSTRELTGVRGRRGVLAAAVLGHFEAIYLDFTARGKKADILAAYTRRMLLVGRRVECAGAAGTVRGVDEAGGLLMEDAGGNLHTVTSGEISITGE